MKGLFAAVCMLLLGAAEAVAQPYAPQEGDFIARGERFADGRTLEEVRIRYHTLGAPRRNRAGEIENAVLLLHGTGGSGRQFLNPLFADELFGPGQPLDVRRHYVIMPDNLGHGGSSKPSDGLRMRFPAYDYDDMVRLQHRLLTEGLGVSRLRLILGTSMGCMHIFVWGETHPEFARALMPLACLPVEIAGANRMWRRMLVEGVRRDPAWAGGEYAEQPQAGLRTAASILAIVGAAPMALQMQLPTHDAAIAEADARIDRLMAGRDANDMIYQFESSRSYDPWPNLERITAPMMWVNSADDFINPRNFDFPAQAIARMPNARFRMIGETAETRGHGTHTAAAFWKDDLIDLLARSGG